MDFFKIVSVVLGAGMLLAGLWASCYLGQAREAIKKLCPEMRPRWVRILSGIALIGLVGTWYQFLVTRTAYAFVVTFVVTLALVKIVGAVFFYRKYREIALAMIEEPLALRVMMTSTAAIGGALLALGLFF